MKYKKSIAFLAALLFSLGLNAQVVNIPDEVFLEYILLYTNTDTNLDGQIQVSEAEAFTGTLNVYNSQAKDLTGLEAFKNITLLQISKTAISNLDISNNTKLQGLFASSTLIDKIDVSKNTSLVQIEAQYNGRLKTIVFGEQNYNDLQKLSLSFNVLENIDLTRCPFLNSLSLTSNKLTSIDVTKNPRLAQFSIGSNNLTSLDVTKNTRLLTLGVGVNQISQLDLTNCKQLDIINANSNPITTLSLSNSTFLTQVLLDQTQISELDLSKLEMLRSLYLNGTKLKNIDLSRNGALLAFQASDSPDLESINIKNGNNVNMTLCVTTNNPKLRCIQVDDPAYSATAFLWQKDPTATYISDCALLAVTDSQLDDNLFVYPNPTIDILNISSKANNISVMNSAGQVVKQSQNSESIDLSTLPAGIYFVNIQRKINGPTVIKKVIKK